MELQNCGLCENKPHFTLLLNKNSWNSIWNKLYEDENVFKKLEKISSNLNSIL